MRTTLTLVLAVLWLAADGLAQMTWIVDASGGAGSHFTSIQPAVNAAADGDLILVRAGNYPQSVVVGKGVRIAADPGVVISSLAPNGVLIANLAAGRSLTISGVRFSPLARVFVRDCPGRVQLEALDLTPPSQSNGFGISNCAQVTLTGVASFGLPALTIHRSRAVLVDCELSASPWITPSMALAVDDADVTVAGGRVTGSAASLSPAGPAIQLNSGSLTLAGRGTLVAAGQDSRTGVPVSAIVAPAGRIDVDPAVSLVSRNGAPPIGGAATVVTRTIPSVRGDGLAPFGTWALDLHAPTASPYCLFVGLGAARAPTPWGELWFDFNAHAVLTCGNVGAGDSVALNVPLPDLPRGAVLVAQGAVALGATVVLTTPSVNVVE